MQTRRLKSFLIIACILAMGAGVVAGMVVSRLPGRSSDSALATDHSGQTHSELADELKLSESQRDQMRSIWEGVRTEVHDTYDQAQALQRQRDDAVIALLTPDQKAKYAELTTKTAEQFATLSVKRDDAFRDGVEKTKQLLDPTQRAEYERILRDRVGAVPSLSPGLSTGLSTGMTPGLTPGLTTNQLPAAGSTLGSNGGGFPAPAQLSTSRPAE